MRLHSGYSRYREWVANVLNARAFRRGPEYPERTRIRDIQDGNFRRPEYHECAHSGYSGYREWATNVLNARAFMTKSGHFPDVLNILNARPFRIFRTPPECACIRDTWSGRRTQIRDIRETDFRLRNPENPDKSTDSATLRLTSGKGIPHFTKVLRIVSSTSAIIALDFSILLPNL